MRVRAAASSIASGMPSSRAQSSPTCGSSTSNAPPPTARRALDEERAGRGPGGGIERADDVDVLARQAERFAAGGDDAHSRTSRQHLVDDLGRRVEDVLAVVEHDETLTVRQCCGQLVERRLTRVDVDEACRGDRGGEVDTTID